MKNCLHVWEFMRDLIKEQDSKLVEWLDKDHGVFKMYASKLFSFIIILMKIIIIYIFRLEPDIVIKMWAEKKNRTIE